jgi:hypothetical protein
MFEIENHSHTALRDPQIIQHQPALVIRDSVDDFCVHHYGIECDQVGDKQADLLFFVEHVERRLLPERDLRSPNSTTSAFSYGFSIKPCPRVLRTSIAQPTI